MITLNSNNGKITVKIQGGQVVDNTNTVYLRERIVLECSSKYDYVASYFHLYYPLGTELLELRVQATKKGTAAIDITDFVRAYSSAGGGMLQVFTGDSDGGTDYIEAFIAVAQGLLPDNVIMPAVRYITRDEDDSDKYNLNLTLPNVIYKSERASNSEYPLYGVIMLNKSYKWYEYGRGVNDITDNVLKSKSVKISLRTSEIRFVTSDKEKELVWTPELLDNCGYSCMFYYNMSTGQEARNIWKVKNLKKTIGDSNTSFMPTNDEYRQTRGETVEFDAYIEGLDAYSYAYYADIIHAAQVKCFFAGKTDWADNYKFVEITTKDVTIPNADAGKLYTLTIHIKYSHYDSI